MVIYIPFSIPYFQVYISKFEPFYLIHIYLLLYPDNRPAIYLFHLMDFEHYVSR